MPSYAGTFTPPTIGFSAMPYPIAGPGRCEITDAGLTLHGFRPATGRAVLLVLAGAVAGAVGVAAVKVLLFPSLNPGAVGAVIGMSVVSGAMVPQKPRMDQALSLEVPWAHIKKVGRNPANKQQPSLVTIHVKRGKPKGMIHFVVDGDADLFAAELQTRI
jgi:hypothetical protein